MKVVVTGGAGFIGSHLVEALTRDGHEVTVLDTFESARAATNSAAFGEGVAVRRFDISDQEGLSEAIRGHDTVYHLAAFTDTTASNIDHTADFRHGTMAMLNLLEAMDAARVRDLVFPSSQLIFGRPGLAPYREEDGPPHPVTLYGASKLSCEALANVYAASFGFRVAILRLANIVGPRQRGGILVDFVHKLTEAPGRLEILGDGRQTRSYVDVADCVAAMRLVHAMTEPGEAALYHVANDDAISAREIGVIVGEVMASGPPVELVTTGGDKGWSGDVPVLQLSNAKIRAAGWTLQRTSNEAVRYTAEWLRDEVRQKGRAR